MLLATVLLVAACSLLGQAVASLCGWSGWRWWSPALGYAALMIIFGLAVHVPSHQRLLLVLAVVLVVASLALSSVRRAIRPSSSATDRTTSCSTLLSQVSTFARKKATVCPRTPTSGKT